jgi:hypothetical protein
MIGRLLILSALAAPVSAAPVKSGEKSLEPHALQEQPEAQQRRPPPEGFDRLNVASMLHPYARSAILFLETINARKSWNPMYRCRPKDMLEAWDGMLRRNFKSVRRIERLEESLPGRFHLVLNLDLHLKLGAVSGSITRVTAQANIVRPDGTLVDQVQVVRERTVPYPAADNMMFEAFADALDGLESGIQASPALLAFARSPRN